MSRLRHLATRLLRIVFRLLQRFARRVPFLRRLRPKTKRHLLRLSLGRLATRLATPSRPAEVDGFRLSLPAGLVPTYVLEDYEPEIRECVARRLEPGMVVADVGANIGMFALRAARAVGPEGRVWAFEPGPDNLEHLRRNLELNGEPPVEVVPCAAGAERSRRSLYLGALGTTHSLSAPGPSGRAVEVETMALDDVIGGRLDFAKIDVEGHELEVLAGMQRLLAENPRLRLIVEWHPAMLRSAGHDVAELPEALRRHGFRLEVLDDPRSIDELIAAARCDTTGKPWRVDLLASPRGPA